MEVFREILAFPIIRIMIIWPRQNPQGIWQLQQKPGTTLWIVCMCQACCLLSWDGKSGFDQREGRQTWTWLCDWRDFQRGEATDQPAALRGYPDGSSWDVEAQNYLLLELKANGRMGHRHSAKEWWCRGLCWWKKGEGAGRLAERHLGGQEGTAER